MKKIFSIILPLLFLGGGIVLAFNVQDDPACSEPLHPGYSYTGPNDEPVAPLDPDEEGLEVLGEFGNDFECLENENEQCHWAYISPTMANPNGSWVKCSGDYEEIEKP
jgi:hypothetical protein